MAKHKYLTNRILWIGVILLFIVLVGLYAVERLYRYRIHNFTSLDGESHGYYIYPNASPDSVLTLVGADYRIVNDLDLGMDSRRIGFAVVRPGYYKFPARFSNYHYIHRLMRGQETPIRLSWTNTVRTRQQLAGRVSRQLMLDSASLMARMDSAEYLQSYGLKPETAVCMWLPNTYEVYWSITPEELFARMYKEYERFWTEERRNQAEALGLTPSEVATLASIVESETNMKSEYPTIAGLYLNRLRIGMPLQACPTAIFASGDFTAHRVGSKQLNADSPYNTYKYAGLPPGPIRCALGTSIDAVLHAERHNYLYMCANPDWSGTHVFSATYAQHSAVARRYQRELNRRKIH